MKNIQVAQFDSTTHLLHSLANFLYGQDIAENSLIPKPLLSTIVLPILHIINMLPQDIRSKLLSSFGPIEATSVNMISKFDSEKLADYTINKYPKKRYKALAIGSTNGALIHLCCCLVMPWLPQTFLLLVKRKISQDDLIQDFDWGKKHSNLILQNNPDLSIYQMNDPVNDRFMSQKMAYFRIKYQKLPQAYKKFIKDTLDPNGTIVIVDCQLKWLATKLTDRYSFQVGGYGGVTLKEYIEGSKNVKEFLSSNNSPYTKFKIPIPNSELIEAEWGFDNALRKDILQFAEKNNYKVKRIVFSDPQDLSSAVSDFYIKWYHDIGLPSNKLFIESFLQIEPYWVIRGGLVPYWTVFNCNPSYQNVRNYLKRKRFDNIYLTTFSLVNAIGIPTFNNWKNILSNARKKGKFVGVSQKYYPVDATTTVKYYFDLLKNVHKIYSTPSPLSLLQFEELLTKNRQKYPVKLIEEL